MMKTETRLGENSLKLPKNSIKPYILIK